MHLYPWLYPTYPRCPVLPNDPDLAVIWPCTASDCLSMCVFV